MNRVGTQDWQPGQFFCDCQSRSHGCRNVVRGVKICRACRDRCVLQPAREMK